MTLAFEVRENADVESKFGRIKTLGRYPVRMRSATFKLKHGKKATKPDSKMSVFFQH